MTPVAQLIEHRPPDAYGDCFRTAIACILDMPAAAVPHFYEGGASQAQADAAAETWLRERGLTMITASIPGNGQSPQKAIESISDQNPGRAFIFIGAAAVAQNPACAHCVVAGNGRVLCDPDDEGGGIGGPIEEHYWFKFIGSAVAVLPPAPCDA